MGFLQEYDALETAGSTPETLAAPRLALLQKWVVQDSNALFAELRASRPIFEMPGLAVVSLYQDVMEVVQLDDVFSVAPYGRAMMQVNGGPNFILGMDSSAELQRDHAILRLAVRGADTEAVRAIASQSTRSLLQAARPAGRLDLTEGPGRAVPAAVLAQYFGVPGPDVPTLLGWIRAMFAAIFLNFAQDAHVAQAGEQAGVELRAYMDTLIAAAHQAHDAGKPAGDTVLARLVGLQSAPEVSFSDGEIRNNLIGCIAGVTENVLAAVVGAMDVLLSRPADMAGAIEAARAGDRDKLRRYILEALRFQPPAPLLVRESTQQYVLGRHTEREATIPAKTIVFAANGSAIMDGSVLEEPESFRLDRPEHAYLHFGWGLHQCLGKYIAQAQLVEIFAQLLLLPNLRRAPGAEGQKKHLGPFPGPLVVEFDGSSA